MYLTSSPVLLENVQKITPLGNFNPPEHTLPTDHVYVDMKSNDDIPLTAPGDVTITSVRVMHYLQENKADYSLDFQLCDTKSFYFLHIKSLVPKIEELITENNCQVYGDGKYKHCYQSVSVPVKSGDLLGTVAGTGNFDFGARDTSFSLKYINPERYREDQFQIVCPLDFFTSELSSQLRNKLDHPLHSCGSTNQDVPGTLQGNWYSPNWHDANHNNWGLELTFGKNNFNDKELIISVGGEIIDSTRIVFTPKSTGVVNRAFVDVKEDGRIYCYNVHSGKLLVKLISSTSLNIEKQSGTCTGGEQFKNPLTYER